MSLLALATLWSGPNQTGSVMAFGLGVGDRYNHVTHDQLSSHGLLDSVASGTLSCNKADLNLILFDKSGYAGGFWQVTSVAGENAGYWHTGPARSVLLIASRNEASKETRLSFRGTFQKQWDTIVDEQLKGSPASRDGEPLLTWRMFPVDNKWLSSTQAYLRIHQSLDIDVPYWSDYNGWMDYHIVLYVDGGGHVRAWVAAWECNVDSGAKHDKIMDKLAPKVKAGMQPLQDAINANLVAFDGAGPFTDVYYLPGAQVTPVTDTLYSHTHTDITIVVVR